MAIEHDVITDPKIHEPKGASSAAADKVYVSDGAGSGAWDDAPIEGLATALNHQALTKESGVVGWKYPAGVVYGEMDMINNAVIQNIAYTNSTPRATWLSTDANYTQMTGASFPFVSTINDFITWDNVNDWFVIEVAGDYKIDFWGSFLCADINTYVAIKYAINNTAPLSPQKLTGQSNSAADVINISAAGIVENLAVGDTVGMYIAAWRAAAGNTDTTFEDGGMTITLLHET